MTRICISKWLGQSWQVFNVIYLQNITNILYFPMPKITPECHLRTRSVLLPLWLDTYSFSQPVVGARPILLYFIPLANHFRYIMWFSNHSILYMLYFIQNYQKKMSQRMRGMFIFRRGLFFSWKWPNREWGKGQFHLPFPHSRFAY